MAGPGELPQDETGKPSTEALDVWALSLQRKPEPPAPREGIGATRSPLPLSPCPDLSLSGPFGELHLKAAFQGLGYLAEGRLAHGVDGDGVSAYLKKVRR